MTNRWSAVGERVEERALRASERAAGQGVARLAVRAFIALAVIGLVGFVVFGGLRMLTTTARDAAVVARQELGPQALNAKYEWFKDSWAALDGKRATLGELDIKIRRLRADYEGVKRNEWSRVDLSAVNQWETERDAILASYNELAALYNAEMAKWHTAFVNAGTLPAGGDGDIPREVRPYLKETP